MPDSSQTRSVHVSETFHVGDKTFRERTEKPVIEHDNLSHDQLNSRTTTFYCEARAKCQRSRIDSEN